MRWSWRKPTVSTLICFITVFHKPRIGHLKVFLNVQTTVALRETHPGTNPNLLGPDLNNTLNNPQNCWSNENNRATITFMKITINCQKYINNIRVDTLFGRVQISPPIIIVTQCKSLPHLTLAPTVETNSGVRIMSRWEVWESFEAVKSRAWTPPHHSASTRHHYGDRVT